MSSSIVTYLIPVYTQVRTIGRAIESAQRALELFEGKLLVCVNKCSDDTFAVANGYSNFNTNIIPSNVYLSALDNAERGLVEINTPYLCFLSGDDYLNLEGQFSIFQHAVLSINNSEQCLYYGDYMKVSANGDDVGLAVLDRSWHSATMLNAMINIINIHLPNLNGAWIPTSAFRNALTRSKNYIPEEYYSNTWDVSLWWCLCHLVRFTYIRSIQVNYTIDDVSTKTNQYKKSDKFKQINGIFSFYEKIALERFACDSILKKTIYRRKIRFLLEYRGIDREQLQGILSKFPVKQNQFMLEFISILANKCAPCLFLIKFSLHCFNYLRVKIYATRASLFNLIYILSLPYLIKLISNNGFVC